MVSFICDPPPPPPKKPCPCQEILLQYKIICYCKAVPVFILSNNVAHLGYNCIQNFHLGRYFVGYTIGNFVLWRRASGAENVFSERISDDIPPQMRILNMVIPILMHFCSFVSNSSIASRIKPHVSQRNVT